MKRRLPIAHNTQVNKENSFQNNFPTVRTFYIHSPIIFFVTFLFFTPLCAIRPQKNHYTHEQEETFTTSKTKNSTQHALIRLFETAPENFKQKHAIKLLHAIDLFHAVPGFFCTMKKVINQARQDSLAHGYLYEIEAALLQEEQGEKVCYFGRNHHAQRPFHNHEIDIETRHYHIECKDIFWEKHHLCSNPEKLKRQLSEQRALIEEENRWAHKPKKFLLCSKQPIPPEWQQWLQQQKIEYRYTGNNEGKQHPLSPSSSINVSAPCPCSSLDDAESCLFYSNGPLLEDENQG